MQIVGGFWWTDGPKRRFTCAQLVKDQHDPLGPGASGLTFANIENAFEHTHTPVVCGVKAQALLLELLITNG